MAVRAHRQPVAPAFARGFTLVELLVALAAMAVLAGLAWSGIDGMLRSREATLTAMDRTLRLSTVLTQWSQDLDAVQETPAVPPMQFDGRTLRLTRATDEGVRVVAWTVRDGAWRRLRGSGDVYGESIFTRRGELFGAYELPAGLPLKLDYSLSYHYQDSYYGADFYEAEQAIAFANLTYPLEVRRHSLLFGLTSRWQSYDDNTVATAREPSCQFIPGVFVQDEWAVADQLTLLSGARLDHYGAHGLIFAPRLNLKYSISDWTSLRLNGGTGFRIVNLFTEDHAFISGQREVVIEESLQPERSYNAAANLHHIYTLGNSQGTMDIDVFFTHFTNKIIPDYSVPGQILYSNTEGHARTAGLSLSLSHQFRFPLSAQLGFNWQRATQTEPDADGQFQTRLIEFAQQWSGVGAFNYNWKKTGITFAYTLNVSGPMALPETFDFGPDGQLLPASRPTESDPFLIHALQVSKAVPAWKLDLYGGVQNLLDYRQPFSPLVGYNDPNARAGFSQNFDTSYAYGPMQGREFYLGLRWSL